MSNWPRAEYKSFITLEGAREWLGRFGVDVKMLPPNILDHNSFPRNLIDGVMVIISDEASNSNSPRATLPILQHKAPPAPNAHTPAPVPEVIVLSPEQKEVFDIVRTGKNVFFTGPAGTGKSILLREIIKLKGGRASSRLGITAATGIAALNIGGTTLHSWGGIGLGRQETSILIKHISDRTKLRSRWTNVKTLIIDEISMIDGRLFDKLEYIARSVRGNQKPFGGIQLPPVSQRNKRWEKIPAKFAFEAETWESCVGKPVALKQVFRQKNQEFVNILNKMRFGRVSEDAKITLGRLSRKIEYDEGIKPTELYPTRREVNSVNHTWLQQLPGPNYTYIAKDAPGIDSDGKRIDLDQAEKLLEMMLVTPRFIQLRVGAQVMLVKNIIQGVLVNGTIGRITKFLSIEEALAAQIQILESYLNEYTDHNHLYSYREDDLPINSTANGNSRQPAVWPVVEFLIPSTSVRQGKRVKITALCIPEIFTVDNAEGGIEAWRVQVPLILAWALSVHKSQGQTLNRVKVDLARTFENGQAYVALSRAKTMECLQINNFHESKVMAHEQVLDWHRQNNLGDS